MGVQNEGAPAAHAYPISSVNLLNESIDYEGMDNIKEMATAEERLQYDSPSS